MAVEQKVHDISLVCGETDMDDYIHHWVQLSDEFSCTVADTADAALIGILQNKPTTTDMVAQVRRLGISKLELGTGGASVGDFLTSDATANGVVAATGERYGAIALEDGSEDTKISVLMEYGIAP